MSTPDDQTRKPRARWTAGAVILVIIGVVIFATSGLCTGLVGLGMLASIFSNTSSLSNNEWATLIGTLGTLLVTGGIPMGIGIVIWWAGLRMRKKE